MNTMKLEKILTIKAQLVCVSGLHIGAGDTEMHIGGIDNTVIRNPLTNLPYIPGSSLKGKMRSLLEWRTGAVRTKPLSWSDYQTSSNREDILTILQLFGAGGADKITDEDAKKIGPTRLSCWDCELNKKWAKEVEDVNLLTTEAKCENSINRITGVADSPRFTERVIAGAKFDFRLSLNVLGGEEEKFIKTIFAGMKLLEKDSLGGSGSRGYGKVRFENVTVDSTNRQEEFDKTDPFA